MKVRINNLRWGEVTIKKQGSKKNDFECTKSFSVENQGNIYTIEEYKEILEVATNLTHNLKYKDLLKKLSGLNV